METEIKVIKKEIFTGGDSKKIALKNKRFVNCSFSDFDCCVVANDVIFQNCVFERCNLFGSFSRIELYNCKVSEFYLTKSHITDFLLEECSAIDVKLRKSFAERINARSNRITSCEVIENFITDLKIRCAEFKHVRVLGVSFLNSQFASVWFDGLGNIVERTHFDYGCFFEDIDFKEIVKNRGGSAKNTVLAGFDNCHNKENLGVASPCPKKGSFIGYKKCYYAKEKGDKPSYYCIVTLEILHDAMRLGQFGSGKCRCSAAKVLSIETLGGEKIEGRRAYSINDVYFPYIIGETVTPDYSFNTDDEKECGSGIHFFMTKDEAINYSE